MVTIQFRVPLRRRLWWGLLLITGQRVVHAESEGHWVVIGKMGDEPVNQTTVDKEVPDA